MTGRDLIIFILANNLEDFKFDIMNEIELATKFNVGTETVKLWVKNGDIMGFPMNDHIYFTPDVQDPRSKK